MTRTTYTEAQYSTPAARTMIRDWLAGERNPAAIERVARYMRDSLRIGGLRACRALVQGAIADEPALLAALTRAEKETIP